jgi:hypothetical protein
MMSVLWFSTSMNIRKSHRFYEDALTAIASAMPDAFEDGDMQDLMSGRRLRLKYKPRNRYPTPSGKIEFCAGSTLADGHTSLPTQKERVADTEYFTFMTSSVSNHTHTQCSNHFCW